MRSVRTTFHILDAVADNQPIGLSELARHLDLPKRTVQRSLATLADLGWIRPEGRDLTRWTLGEKVRILSEKVDDVGALREAALPILGQLNTDTLETIHLVVLESRTVRLIERLDSKHRYGSSNRSAPARPCMPPPPAKPCSHICRSGNRSLHRRRPGAGHRQHHHRPRGTSR